MKRTQTKDRRMQLCLGQVWPLRGENRLYDVVGRCPLEGVRAASWDEAVDAFSAWAHDQDCRWRYAPEFNGLVYGQRGRIVYVYPLDDEQAGAYYDLTLEEMKIRSSD